MLKVHGNKLNLILQLIVIAKIKTPCLYEKRVFKVF